MRYDEVLDGLRSAYDDSAMLRESSSVQDWKQEERQRFLDLLRAENARRLIDVGAGTGVHGKWFQENGLEVVCTDLSPELVRLCQDKGLQAHVMDFQHLDFPPGSFDAMFALNCLLHVPRADLQRTLTRLRHILKPGGLFYWGQYGGSEFEGIWQDDPNQTKRFFSYMTNEEIEDQATRLFEMVGFRYISLENARGEYGFQSLILRR